jgi:hypothetical protein
MKKYVLVLIFVIALVVFAGVATAVSAQLHGAQKHEQTKTVPLSQWVTRGDWFVDSNGSYWSPVSAWAYLPTPDASGAFTYNFSFDSWEWTSFNIVDSNGVDHSITYRDNCMVELDGNATNSFLAGPIYASISSTDGEIWHYWISAPEAIANGYEYAQDFYVGATPVEASVTIVTQRGFPTLPTPKVYSAEFSYVPVE